MWCWQWPHTLHHNKKKFDVKVRSVTFLKSICSYLSVWYCVVKTLQKSHFAWFLTLPMRNVIKGCWVTAASAGSIQLHHFSKQYCVFTFTLTAQLMTFSLLTSKLKQLHLHQILRYAVAQMCRKLQITALRKTGLLGALVTVVMISQNSVTRAAPWRLGMK